MYILTSPLYGLHLLPGTTFNMTPDGNLTGLYSVDGMARHDTCVHHDENDGLEVQNRNPVKPSNFSFTGVLDSKVCSHLRVQKLAQKSNKRTLSRCLTTSSKTKASDA